MKKIFKIISICIVCGWLQGCKTTSLPTQEITLNIPATFLPVSDSSNMALLSWKEYYSDSTLLSLIENALANNPDGKIALQRMEQAKASVIFTKGQLLPAAYAGGVAGVRRFGLYTMDGAGNATTDILPGQIVPVNLPDYLVGLQASWEADITGRLRNQKAAAISRYLGSMEGRNWVVTNLVAEMALQYYQLQALDQELEIIRSTIHLQERALDIVTVQKESGAANALAVDQFKAQLLNTQAMEFDVRQKILDTENQINLLLGRFPQPVARQKTEKTSFPTKLHVGVPSQLLANRPDIRQAELELVAARADVRAARAAFFPNLTITASAGFQAFKTSLLFNTPESFVFTLLGGLWAPLLNRSAIKAGFANASAYQVEALYQYHKTILTGYADVYRGISYLSNLQEIALRKENEVNVLLQAVDTAHELYRTGRANYLEVLLIQQNALAARLELINTNLQQQVGSVYLYKALGGGWR
ncbi:MAG: TolC family protein [Bacteroidota bacterium]